jgi:D-alanine--poly(phosphoribitol) ligase subunit 2
MNTNEMILRIIFDAVAEINEQRPPDQRLTVSPDMVIFGKEGKLDSLGLVSLIVAVEQRIEDEYGVAVTLADERAVSASSSPFRTAASLADYVCKLLGDRANV